MGILSMSRIKHFFIGTTKYNKILVVSGFISFIITVYDSAEVIFDQSSKLSDRFSQETLETYEGRRTHLQKMCQLHHEKLEEDYALYQPEESFQSIITKVDLLYSKNNIPFLWCRVPKAASQSWTDLFVDQWYKENASDLYLGKKQRLLREEWSLSSSTSMEFYYAANDNIFSFMVTRHPFDRILSAFRDKFFRDSNSPSKVEDFKIHKFMTLYGNDILKNYRKFPPGEEKYENSPTFKEFIDYLLDLPLEKFDNHWLPTYFQCLPFAHKTQGKSSDLTVEKYYGELDKSTLDRLYKLYEMDFILFDYEPDSYYQYVPNNTSQNG